MIVKISIFREIEVILLLRDDEKRATGMTGSIKKRRESNHEACKQNGEINLSPRGRSRANVHYSLYTYVARIFSSIVYSNVSIFHDGS